MPSPTLNPSLADANWAYNHPYFPPNAGESRSPCPALNALANHGYISRTGANIHFWDLLYAVKYVYNLSFPLSLVLTVAGFLTCGSVSLTTDKKLPATTFFTYWLTFPSPTWTLHLDSLCTHGPLKIAHNASLVHPDNIPSSSPDPILLAQLLHFARRLTPKNGTTTPNLLTPQASGLTLTDLARLHAAHGAALRRPLCWLHEQIAEGECALAWRVLREHPFSEQKAATNLRHCSDDEKREQEEVIPVSTLERWFGEERLPDGWWDLGGGRPLKEVELLEVARNAKVVGECMSFPGGLLMHKNSP